MRTNLNGLSPEQQAEVLEKLDNLLDSASPDEIIDQSSLMLIELLQSESIVEKDKKSALFIHSQLRFFFKNMSELIQSVEN